MTADRDPGHEELPVRRGFGLAMAGVLFLGAIALVWAGYAVSPADRDAMEGAELLLFSLIPIRPFAWIMAGVFTLLGGLTALKSLRS